MISRVGKPMGPSGRVVLTPIQKVLDLAGLRGISADATYMQYPNDPSRTSGNRHYLYVPGSGWVNDGTLSAGVMAATGVISDGGTFSYTEPAATIMTAVITWANGGSPVTSFQIGFTRDLTAGEQAALSQTSFWAQLFAGTAIATGDCSIAFNAPSYIEVNGVKITVDGAYVTAP